MGRPTTLSRWRSPLDRVGDDGAGARVRRLRVAPAGARAGAGRRGVRGGRSQPRGHLLAGRRPLHPWRRPGELERRRWPASAAGRRDAAPVRAARARLRRRHRLVPATRSRAACWRCGPAARSRSRSAPRASEHELSVTVEEYLPRLAARAGAPPVDGRALREGAEPVPCRRQPPLLRAARAEPARVRVTVFGATGVVGQALAAAARRRARGRRRLARPARAPAASAGSSPTPRPATGVAAGARRSATSSTTSFTRSVRATSSEQDRAAAENVVARGGARAGVRQIVYLGGLGGTTPTPRRTCAAAARPASASPPTACR